MQSDSSHPHWARKILVWLVWLLPCLCGLAQETPLPQTITWLEPQAKLARLHVPVTLQATASSGLPVTFSLLTGPASLDGDVLTATNVGSIGLEITAPGTNGYAPATLQVVLNPLAFQVTPPIASLLLSSVSSISSIRVQGQYAYVAAGRDGLMVVDLQNPEAPKVVGKLDTEGVAYGLDVVGDRVYVADGSGLVVADASDPSHPVQLSRTTLPGTVLNVRVQDGWAYLAARDEGLILLDVSDPTWPIHLVKYNTAGDTTDVAVQGSFVFLADGPAGLRVLDASNPRVPTQVAAIATPTFAGSLQIRQGIAYVRCDRSVAAFDIRQPETPRQLDSIETGGGSLQAPVLAGNTALLAGGPEAIDVTLASDLRKASRLGDYQSSHVLALAGDNLLMGYYGTFVVSRWRPGAEQSIVPPRFTELAFTNAPLPLLTANSGLPLQYSFVLGPAEVVDGQLKLTGVGDVWVQMKQPGDDQFFPTAANWSFRVLPNQAITWIAPTNAVLKPGMPQRLHAEASSGLPVTYRVLAGPAQITDDELVITNVSVTGSVVVAAEQAGSDIYVPVADIRHFNQPAVAGTLLASDPGHSGLMVQVVGSIAYLANTNSLRILDLRDPQNAVEIGSAPMPGYNSYPEIYGAITVDGQHAYVTYDNQGTFIFDVSDPAHPTFRSQIYFERFARRVVVQDQKLYVATAAQGLVIYDVQDPGQPVQLASLRLPGMKNPTDWWWHTPTSLRVRGNIAYVLGYDLGLFMVDVSEPREPRLVGTQWIWQGVDLDVREDLSAVIVRRPYFDSFKPPATEITTVDLHDPEHPVLLGNLPNAIHGIVVQVVGNLAYVGAVEDGIQVVDLTDPAHPSLLHRADWPNVSVGYAQQILDGIAYWANPTGLYSADMRPRIPAEIDPLLALPPTLGLTAENQALRLSWNHPSVILEAAPTPEGPWAPVPGATSPHSPAMDGDLRFFRLHSAE